MSLSLTNEDWVKPQLQICYPKMRLKWIIVNRLENWPKSEMKNAQVSSKQKKNENQEFKNISLSLPNEDWVKPQLQICYSKIRLKRIVVNRLENWRKSELKKAQISHKQKNKNNKNLKTYHYHYLMRTGLSLSYRYVILKWVWNKLLSTDWKIDVKVKWKTHKSTVKEKKKE